MKPQVPGYYGSRFAFDRKREHVWKVLAGWIGRRYIRPDAAVLDLGCGYCGFINNVRAEVRRGIDLSPVSRTCAAPDVQVKVGDAVSLLAGFTAKSFDVVFASNFLEHLDRPVCDRVLAGVLRTLKPGGRFIVLQPNFRLCFRNYFDDYTHRTVFTDAGLKDYLIASGFRVESCRPGFLPFSMKSGAGFFYWLIGLYLFLPFKPGAGQMLVVAKKPD